MNDILQFSDRDFRKWLAQRLVVDQALEPGDELYEPLYDGVAGDPVSLLFDDIDLSEVESLNFLSGFRGSGKTSELFRLRKRLRGQGYFVAYANALDFLPPSEPIEISDFLLVLAGSFSDAIETEFKTSLAHESFWQRFANFLTKTNVTINGFDTKASVPGTDIGLNIKTALKEVPSFRQQVREKMTSRIGELRREVHEFFEFGRQRIRAATNSTRNPVFLFDQFEQLKDTIATEGKVAESVATLMANHRSDLKVPNFHMVLTVPPWLKFKLPDMTTKIRWFYNVKLWKNDDKRTRDTQGWKTMRRVVERRLTGDGIQRYFGTPNKRGEFRGVEKLIDASGGHFRDLIRLLRETVLRAASMPIDDDVVEAAISELRTSYLPVPLADAKWLHQIGNQRDCLLADRSLESVQRMTFFLDTHCALILKNGDEWYDVHPLIRDEVAEIVKREEAAKPASSTPAAP
jgi:hypothetical protein